MKDVIKGENLMIELQFDPFGGAKLRPLGRCVKRRSGSTQSKPQNLCWGVEGLTLVGLNNIEKLG